LYFSLFSVISVVSVIFVKYLPWFSDQLPFKLFQEYFTKGETIG
jgi:hypothetical protein